ncbi:calcium-binding protein [Planktotalea sp.]|uniref:calcium-binding protein n=1 Tax=Planktotalea sp. TaxID=2029877 RepID=UPI003D6BCE53
MATFFYSGADLPSLTLDVASGFDHFDAQMSLITGTATGNIFDLTGILTYEGANLFELRDGADQFVGSIAAEQVIGGNGSDTLQGGGGIDVLTGGSGNDFLHTGFADGEIDAIDGGTDTDTLVYGGFAIKGFSFTSIENFDASGLTVIGTSEDDAFDLKGVQSYVNGNVFELKRGSDVFVGSGQAEDVHGGKGDDTIEGRGGQDILRGGGGVDTMLGGKGADHIYTGVADASIDLINGGGGVDTVHYGGRAIEGFDLTAIENFDAGNTLIEGTANANTFDLTGIQTYVDGSAFKLRRGNDTFNGSDQDETIGGGRGMDTLEGGGGNDVLTGGKGDDRFVFNDGFGDDTITDFNSRNAEDIDLSGVIAITDFSDLLANHLRDNGGEAEIFTPESTLLLQGISVDDIGIGLAYSASDFIF